MTGGAPPCGTDTSRPERTGRELGYSKVSLAVGPVGGFTAKRSQW